MLFRLDQTRYAAHVASALAREAAEPLSLPPCGAPTVLVVQLGDRPWALPISAVCAVERLRIAPLPGAPSRVAGLGALRGRVIPIFDLRVALGLPAGPPALDPARSRLVVIAGSRDDEVGLLIDGATGTEAWDLEALLPVSAASEEGRLLALLRGAGPDGTPVLDLHEMLGSELLTAGFRGGT